MWMIALFQLVVPLAFIALIAFQRQANTWTWVVNCLAFGLAILFMWVSSRWDILSMHFRILLPLLLLAAVVSGYRRIGTAEKKPGKWAVIAGLLINLFVLVMMAGLSWKSIEGYLEPDGAISLKSPLRDGRYAVLHGGASPFINGHFHVRPQNHALDIVGVNALGVSVSAFAKRNVLEAYPIYGDTLYSPCNGTVVIAVDQFEDQVPPKTDRENLAGNHIVLMCEGVEVVLAHMKAGSVSVSEGANVTTETVLGQVGNTGNTSEPHLHIHAETGGAPGVILDGRAVPMKIGGRHLVRGNILPPGKAGTE